MSQDSGVDERRALAALLDYYRALGVDCALDAAPHDRYLESGDPVATPAPMPPAPRKAPAPPPRGAAPILTPQEAERAAQDIAAAANSLDELREGLARFEGGGPMLKARHFLFARGAPSDLMAIDYAPGEAEESTGAAFSGEEARLLGAMLAAIGRSFDDVYCIYFSPWRPPGGQKLSSHVSSALAPFARRHIELSRPKALLLLGDVAKSLLETQASGANLYAQRFDLKLQDEIIDAVPAPGLAAMLKAGALKAQAWRALRLLDALLKRR